MWWADAARRSTTWVLWEPTHWSVTSVLERGAWANLGRRHGPLYRIGLHTGFCNDKALASPPSSSYTYFFLLLFTEWAPATFFSPSNMPSTFLLCGLFLLPLLPKNLSISFSPFRSQFKCGKRLTGLLKIHPLLFI